VNRFLVRLYPADWRARYGDEFGALLDERPLGPFDVVDIALSAFDARLRSRGASVAGEPPGGIAMTLRVGGYAAIVGGILYTFSLAGSAITHSDNGQPWIFGLLAALFALIVAMIGLSAVQARREPALIWAAVAIPVIGAAISILGLIGMLAIGDRPVLGDMSPWSIWLLGTLALIVGSGLFALATLRIPSLSRLSAALLAIGAVAVVPLMAGVVSLNGPGDPSGAFAILAIFAFAAGWVGLGVSALRIDRAATATYGEAIP
jgi:hypothetical protein